MELRSTGDSSLFSLATSLDNIIDYFHHDHSQLTDMPEYRDIMRELYSPRSSKEQFKYLNITKVDLHSKFTNPRTNQPPIVTKRGVCMDWFHFQPWKDNWMKRWFMVFDKPACNNMDVPLYFLRKTWAEFVLGLHVNYFDITKF